MASSRVWIDVGATRADSRCVAPLSSCLGRGQRVSGRNLERLSNVYFTIKRIPADSPSDRRHALFAPHNGLPSLFDSLVALALKAGPSPGGMTVARRLGVAAN